jgi:putative transposase
MPRTARAGVGGYCYHTLKHGNGRAQVFHDADNYHTFIRLLRRACTRLPMRRVGYCLMPNHFHLVVWPRGDDDLRVWMQGLLTAHFHSYQRRHGGSGHGWQGRFKAFPIEENEHLLSVLRCVERNPLRAGLVARVEDWPWSSLAGGSSRCCPGSTPGRPAGRPRKQSAAEDGEEGLFGRKES